LKAAGRSDNIRSRFTTIAMSAEKVITERILSVLRPYSANWSGTLSRGDLVIPQGQIPSLVREILSSVQEVTERHGEAAEQDVFGALMALRQLPSVQDQAAELRRRFRILVR
jgi:hypothetical protein